MTARAAYGLTPAQRDTLLVLQELTALGGGVAPSISEIGRELCVTTRSAVHRTLTILRDKGHIDWLPCRARSIAILRAIPPPEEPAFELTAAGVLAAASLEAGVRGRAAP